MFIYGNLVCAHVHICLFFKYKIIIEICCSDYPHTPFPYTSPLLKIIPRSPVFTYIGITQGAVKNPDALGLILREGLTDLGAAWELGNLNAHQGNLCSQD